VGVGESLTEAGPRLGLVGERPDEHGQHGDAPHAELEFAEIFDDFQRPVPGSARAEGLSEGADGATRPFSQRDDSPPAFGLPESPVGALGPGGGGLWARGLRVPLSRAAGSSDGELLAAHGFDLQLLDARGEPVWRSASRPDNQLLEDVVFAPDGRWLVARSTNASGVGHVFAFNRGGQLWGPTRAYISAADVALNPDTGTVAVASSNQGENHIVLITPDGHLDQRFGVDGELHRVLFTQTGEHTVAVTNRSSQIFDSARGDLLWRIGYPSTAAARLPRTDTIVLAGPHGLGAFSVNGTELWRVPGLAVERLLVTDAYVVSQTSERTFAVHRADGSHLGQLVTSSDIRAVAAAPAANLLLTANAERAIEAWQLPEVEPAAG